MSVSREWLLVVESFPLLIRGLYVTIYLSIGSMLGALILGLLIALIRVAKVKYLKNLVGFYVSFFRGTPLLVQLFIIYFGLTSFNILLDPIPAAFIGLIFHFSAYISEIFRAAMLSIDRGQWEAAYSLGMNYILVIKEIILPQAFRRSIPPIWNSFIDTVKSSSLASAITVPEITKIVGEQSAAQFVFMPYFLTLAFFYWIIIILLGFVQDWLEKKYNPMSD